MRGCDEDLMRWGWGDVIGMRGCDEDLMGMG